MWDFFPKVHLILLLCVHTAAKPLPPLPSWSQDAMTMKAACDWHVTQQHKPDLQPRLSHRHTGVKSASAYNVQLMLAWHHAQEVNPPVLFEQLWACRVGIGVLPPPPLVLGVRCPEAGSGTEGRCAVLSNSSRGEGGQPAEGYCRCCLLSLQLWLFAFYSWSNTCFWVTEIACGQ